MSVTAARAFTAAGVTAGIKASGRPDLALVGTKEAALRGADALLIATEWKNFRAPSFELMREQLGTPVIFDGRNLYDPAVVSRHGLTYISIGRKAG